MSDIISKLKTPEECANLEENALKLGNTELATQARKRAIELRAQAHSAASQAERECIEAVYAYERVLTEQRGRTTRASRTWQMIQRYGIIGAAERAVNRHRETSGYRALVEMGLEQFAFEAVILRHPQVFSAEAVERSRQRIGETPSS
jgi:vacuolar-type H+-ATPase subunit H